MVDSITIQDRSIRTKCQLSLYPQVVIVLPKSNDLKWDS